MSATQELIAASLTLADMDERVAEMPTQAAADVREACARAMVQPDMVPEGWQVVPKEPTDSMLRAIRRQRSGGRIGVGDRADWSAWLAAAPDHFRDAAEMVPAAWQVWCGLGKMQPYWPVFRTKEEAEECAKTIKTYTEVRPLWSHASAAPQPVGAAEVPMPESDGFLSWNSENGGPPRVVEVTAIERVRTYGDAREAAGVAAGGKDAERYRYLRNRDAQFVLTTSGPEAGCFIDFENEDGMLVLLTGADADALIDAALRGEVKP